MSAVFLVRPEDGTIEYRDFDHLPRAMKRAKPVRDIFDAMTVALEEFAGVRFYDPNVHVKDVLLHRQDFGFDVSAGLVTDVCERWHTEPPAWFLNATMLHRKLSLRFSIYVESIGSRAHQEAEGLINRILPAIVFPYVERSYPLTRHDRRRHARVGHRGRRGARRVPAVIQERAMGIDFAALRDLADGRRSERLASALTKARP